MDVKDFYRRAVTQATEEMNQVEEANLPLPTPDTEWDVKTLASHMLYELAWVPDILQGRMIAEVGDAHEGDLIRGDAGRSWAELLAKALAAVETADVHRSVHLSYANVTAEEYLWQNGSDLLIHAWDLGMALAKQVNFVPEVAEAAYAYAVTRKKQMQESGLFGRAVEVPDTADIQTKLLALYGRSGTGLKF